MTSLSEQFQNAAQTHNSVLFKQLCANHQTLSDHLTALNWACVFNRADMVEEVLNHKVLDARDLQTQLRTATAHKSLKSIQQILFWCKWNGNKDQRRRYDLYIQHVAYEALKKDWLEGVDGLLIDLKNLPAPLFKHLLRDAVAEGAAGCLTRMDQGHCMLYWRDWLSLAAQRLQAQSLTYIGRACVLGNEKERHTEMTRILSELITDSHFPTSVQARRCALALLEFVTPQDLWAAHPRTQHSKYTAILDELVSKHQRSVLTQVANVAGKTETKRKI